MRIDEILHNESGLPAGQISNHSLLVMVLDIVIQTFRKEILYSYLHLTYSTNYNRTRSVQPYMADQMLSNLGFHKHPVIYGCTF